MIYLLNKMSYSLHRSVAGWLLFPLSQHLEALELCSCLEQALRMPASISRFLQELHQWKTTKEPSLFLWLPGSCERWWKLCWTSSSLWSSRGYTSILPLEYFLQADSSFWGIPPEQHRGSFPMPNPFQPQISISEIMTDTLQTCFFLFSSFQAWKRSRKV